MQARCGPGRILILFGVLAILARLLWIHCAPKPRSIFSASRYEPEPVSRTKTCRVGCVVLARNSEAARMESLFRVWGHGCDRLFFVLNDMDREIGKRVRAVGGMPLFTGVDEGYSKLWTRMVSAWARLADERDDCTWYLKADLDTFVNMARVHRAVEDASPESGTLLGYPIAVGEGADQHALPSGGAGYLVPGSLVRGAVQGNAAEWARLQGGEDELLMQVLREASSRAHVDLEQAFDADGCTLFVPVGVEEMLSLDENHWLSTRTPRPSPGKKVPCTSSAFLTHHQLDLITLDKECGANLLCQHATIGGMYLNVNGESQLPGEVAPLDSRDL